MWVGIGIGERDAWNNGYGTDAMKLCLRYSFLELGARRVSLGLHEYNSRALRSYEKAGFQMEGRTRKEINREGKRTDVLWMGRSLTFAVGRHLFPGDLVLYRSIGFLDYRLASRDDVVLSIRRLYDTVPDESVLHSGHGEDSRVGTEKRENRNVTATEARWKK